MFLRLAKVVAGSGGADPFCPAQGRNEIVNIHSRLRPVLAPPERFMQGLSFWYQRSFLVVLGMVQTRIDNGCP
jgi:hypothetical protein